MILIIDAYNFLRHNGSSETISSSRYNTFINNMMQYAINKNLEIMIIFDGFSNSKSEISNKYIEVIFAGPRKSADDYIIKYISKAITKNITVVTSDNKLCAEVNSYGILCVDVDAFKQLLQNQNSNKKSLVKSQSKAIKLCKDDDSMPNEELDALMEASCKNIKSKDILESCDIINKNKLSRKEKKISKIINKL